MTEIMQNLKENPSLRPYTAWQGLIPQKKEVPKALLCANLMQSVGLEPTPSKPGLDP